MRELDVKPPVEPDPDHDNSMDIMGGNVKFGGGLASWTTLRFTF